jgi:hypothetical protein
MRRQHRHPVLEAAVFAAALLLAGFVGRELWRRRAPEPEVPKAGFEDFVPDVAVNPTRPPLPGRGRTETAVTTVPSVKLTRIVRRKEKSVPVPLPR